VRYAEAVEAAPPGSERFQATDVGRLSRTALNLLFQPGPSAPPLEDAAAALASEPAALQRLASALTPSRGERLLRLSQRPTTPADRAAAARRLVRGSFWFLTYELAPELWDRLAAAEPVSPELLAELPADRARVLDVGAGSGRLTSALASRAAVLVAVEPSPPLRRILAARFPCVTVIAGVGHQLPILSGWADLVVSCATFGPHPPQGGDAVLAELERCLKSGGTLAMVGPEEPAWWQERGFRLFSYPVPEARLEPDLEAFFGPAHPPHRLLLKHV
jgi:SAM-dependent methyltransferase